MIKKQLKALPGIFPIIKEFSRILGEKDIALTISDIHVRVTQSPGKCRKKFRVVVSLIDIDLQQYESPVQLDCQGRVLGQETVQHMAPLAPVSSNLNQHSAAGILCQLQCRSAVGKRVSPGIIILAVSGNYRHLRRGHPHSQDTQKNKTEKPRGAQNKNSPSPVTHLKYETNTTAKFRAKRGEPLSPATR